MIPAAQKEGVAAATPSWSTVFRTYSAIMSPR